MEAQDNLRNQMLELVRRWRKSGVPARAFAQEHGVTVWKLYYWRDYLARQERPKRRRRRSRRVKLAPVHLIPTAADAGQSDLEIVLASGDRVQVSPRASVETLRHVIAILRTRC